MKFPNYPCLQEEMADWMMSIFPDSKYELDRLREGTSQAILNPGLPHPSLPHPIIPQVIFTVRLLAIFDSYCTFVIREISNIGLIHSRTKYFTN